MSVCLCACMNFVCVVFAFGMFQLNYLQEDPTKFDDVRMFKDQQKSLI